MNFGIGKGGFIAEIASKNQNINYIGIDMVEAMLGIANRKINEVYKEKNLELSNIRIVRQNIDYINKIFNDKDIIEKIYINFCNPWPRKKHNKRRLTHPLKIEMYKSFLKKDGQIYFKTDSDELFEDSINYFKDNGYEIIDYTEDLDKRDIFNPNIETEHEKMFKNANLKIKALIAKGGRDD